MLKLGIYPGRTHVDTTNLGMNTRYKSDSQKVKWSQSTSYRCRKIINISHSNFIIMKRLVNEQRSIKTLRVENIMLSLGLKHRLSFKTKV